MKESIKELLILPIMAFIISLAIYGCLSQSDKRAKEAKESGYEEGYRDGYSDALMKYGIEE